MAIIKWLQLYGRHRNITSHKVFLQCELDVPLFLCQSMTLTCLWSLLPSWADLCNYLDQQNVAVVMLRDFQGHKKQYGFYSVLSLSSSLSLLLSFGPRHHFLRQIAHMERPSVCIPTDNGKEAPYWQPASLPDMWLKEPSDDSSPQYIFQLRPQIWWKWKMKVKVTQSYPTLCNTMEFSRPEYWSG